MHEVEEAIQDSLRRHAQSEEKLRILREEIQQLKWMVEQAKKCAAPAPKRKANAHRFRSARPLEEVLAA